MVRLNGNPDSIRTDHKDLVVESSTDLRDLISGGQMKPQAARRRTSKANGKMFKLPQARSSRRIRSRKGEASGPNNMLSEAQENITVFRAQLTLNLEIGDVVHTSAPTSRETVSRSKRTWKSRGQRRDAPATAGRSRMKPSARQLGGVWKKAIEGTGPGLRILQSGEGEPARSHRCAETNSE